MGTNPKGKLTYFPGEDGEWYWHYTAPNGNIISGGGEGYTTQESAAQGFESMKKDLVENNYTTEILKKPE